MSTGQPTHVQFTVLRARNLISKGKGGNNDVFVTIHLGKEKYQTSTIKNALHPEWFEECDLPIPFLQAEIEVTLYHRGVLSDDFLGYASIPLWSNLNNSAPQGSQSQWVTLRGKPSAKSGSSSKNRGELEVKLTFHVKSPQELSPHQGLKKQRPNSIRSFAMAFGDKFKFSRSRSFRENRKDPEGGGKLDKVFAGGEGTKNGSGLDDDGLTRSYSLSAAYIKSMSLDRQAISLATTSNHKPTSSTTNHASSTTTSTANSNTTTVTNKNSKNSNSKHGNIGNTNTTSNPTGANVLSTGNMYETTFHDSRGSGFIPNHYHEPGVNQLHSQSMYNLPGSRQSYGDLPLHRSSSSSTTTTTTAPPPYDPNPYHPQHNPHPHQHPHSHHHSSLMQSKDDTDLYSIPRHHRRTVSDYQISHGFNNSHNHNNFNISNSNTNTNNNNSNNNNNNSNINHPLQQSSPNPAGLFPENNSNNNNNNTPSSNNNAVVVRDHSIPRASQAVYESIKERTEPENSPSSSCASSDDPESVPKPRSSRGKRFTRREVPVMGSSGRDYAKIGGLVALPPPPPPPPMSVNLNVTHSSSSSSRTLTNPAIISSNVNNDYSTTANSTTNSITTPSTIPSSSSSFIIQQQQHQQQQQQQQHHLLQQSISSTFSTRDSGIVEDRSSSQTNSHDGGSFTTPDSTLTSGGIPATIPSSQQQQQHSSIINPESFHQPLSDFNPLHHSLRQQHHHQQQQHHHQQQLNNSSTTKLPKSHKNLNLEDSHSHSNMARANSSGSIFYHVTSTRDIQLQGGPGGLVAKESSKKQVSAHQSHQLFGSRDIGGMGMGGGGVGVLPGFGGPAELVVRKRTRGQRDRLRQMRQDNRRVTVQGLANHHQASSGLYDDSLSDFSDEDRDDAISENLISAYKNMTKEELLRVAIQTKAQMIRKEKYIKDLENYIDDLLVRVMETTPRLLTRKGQHHQHRI